MIPKGPNGQPMMWLADLRPGDLMFGPIGGLIPGVFPVGLGQLLLADNTARLSWRRWWKVRHVGVVVEAGNPLLGAGGTVEGGPRLVQAMPRGAEEIYLDPFKHWTADYVYVRPHYGTIEERRTARAGMVAAHARKYLGTPYNFLTYGKLAAAHFHLPISTRVLRKWISTRKDMMCSQLADQALSDAGFHVFDDGRLPQDVVPAELFRQLILMPGTRVIVPGQGWSETLGDSRANP